MTLLRFAALLLPLAASLAASAPSSRPDIVYSPYNPTTALAESSERTKVCYVNSHGDDSTDDSEYILEAINSCNPDGHVVFNASAKYIIGTALDLSDLNRVDLDIQGTIQFTNDTDYWQENGFYHTFQNATTFFILGGTDVNVYGGGTLDGNGQVWYDLYASNKLILRPILFGTIGLDTGVIADLNLRYSPQWYNFVANSTNVVFDNISITGYSKSKNTAKNTDGWDTYRSDGITIQNSVINNGDDCVAFKPNSTNILVQSLYCNGSHGISVGSLGQYVEEVDIIRNVMVSNVSMYNSSDGARIKVWPGVASALSTDLQGGGGSGSVSNVTYENMYIEDVDYAIEVTQCYGQKNQTLCEEYPASLTISDILFSGFNGTTSSKYEPIVGSIVCSSTTVCSNITAVDINVKSPEGSDEFTCKNVDESLLDIDCTS